MNAYKLITNIPKERKIVLDIPTSFPVGPVEIIMLYPDSENTSVSEGVITKAYGSLKGSHFTTDRYLQLKNQEKALDK